MVLHCRNVALFGAMPTPDATARESAPRDRALPDVPRDPIVALTPAVPATALREVGGPPGPEPTRFGDWERAGRCIDF